MYTGKWPHTILGMKETLSYLHVKRCSIGRYGDGEIRLMNGIDIAFQKATDDLRRELIDVANSRDNGFLVCIPLAVSDQTPYTFNAKLWWSGHLLWWKNRPLSGCGIAGGYKQFFSQHEVLGDSQVTRPWMSTQNVELASECFQMLRHEWDDKNIILIEGCKTRIGVGNDYLDNAKSVTRILGPAEDAYSKIDKIYEATVAIAETVDNAIILLALGPTATVLAYRLFKAGFRALDIGHVDVEYEWFKMKAKKKIALPNKYVNEAGGMKALVESKDMDQKYLDQIACSIE